MSSPKISVPPPPPGGDAALYLNSLTDGELTRRYLAFYAAAQAAPPQDPALVELLRLRNGVAQSCEYCLSVRLVDDERFDRALPERLLRFEEDDGFSPREKAALRLAEAFLTLPRSLSAEARRELLAHFTPAEIVGLAVRLAAFLVNKPRAALGIDAPLDPAGPVRIDPAAALDRFQREAESSADN